MRKSNRLRMVGFRRWNLRRKRKLFRFGAEGLNTEYDPKSHLGASITHYGIIVLNGELRAKRYHDLRYHVLAHEILHQLDSRLPHSFIDLYQRKLGQILHDLLISKALPSCGCPVGGDVAVKVKDVGGIPEH